MKNATLDFNLLNSSRIQFRDPVQVGSLCQQLRCTEVQLRGAAYSIGGNIGNLRRHFLRYER
jgi:hypothetical protein